MYIQLYLPSYVVSMQFVCLLCSIVCISLYLSDTALHLFLQSTLTCKEIDQYLDGKLSESQLIQAYKNAEHIRYNFTVKCFLTGIVNAYLGVHFWHSGVITCDRLVSHSSKLNTLATKHVKLQILCKSMDPL